MMARDTTKLNETRFLKGLTVFAKNPNAKAHLRRVKKARRTFYKRIARGDSVEEALRTAFKGASGGRQDYYQRALYITSLSPE